MISVNSSGNFWIPTHSTQHIDLFYSANLNDNKLGLSFKIVNHSPNNYSTSLNIKFLQSNDIKSVQSATLNGLVSLQKLDLSSNVITSFVEFSVKI